jgi:hypothetical protein
VVDSDRIDALRAKESGRKGRSNEVVAEAARARAELLREERCVELLTRAGALEVRVAPAIATANAAPASNESDVATIDDLADLREDAAVERSR